MTAMNPMNGVQSRPTYAMAPEFTNNNYLMGAHQVSGALGNFGTDHVTVQQSRAMVYPGNMDSPQPQIFIDGPDVNIVNQNELYEQCLNQNVLNSENARVTNCPYFGLNEGNTFDSGQGCQQVPNNLTMGSGNFTFTSPTTIQSPGITSLPMSNRFIQPHAFAPTSCLQWQHTVPQRIPWSACGTSKCEQDILHFTGNGSTSLDVTFANQSIPVCSLPQRKSPIPSCSHPPRRLKRRAPDSQGYAPSKVHLTEDMISKHMQGLQIENGAVSSTGQGQVQTSQHWQKFLELEDRLSVSDDEDNSGPQGNQPRLHIVEDIVNMVKSEPTIPQEIMHKISNPHMELVLWTPPGGAIKDFIESNNKSSQNSEPSNNIHSIENLDMTRSNIVTNLHSLPSSIGVNMEEEGMMDIETDEDLML